MKASYCLFLRKHLIPAVLLVLALASVSQLRAQPTIVSVNPADGATGVSTSTHVVFTFSSAMNTSSQAYFTNSAGSFIPVSMAWSSGNTVLTCTPTPSFPASTVVYWTVFAFDAAFNQVSGTGSFTTGGSSTTGSGTNQYTTFSLSKMYIYDQVSASAPVLDTNAPYFFSATTALASNRTATTITLLLASGGTSNLTQNITAPEDWYFFGFDTNQSRFEATFAQGTYTFNVQATASNQPLAVLLPADMTQPNAPHLTNYTAAQAVDATKDFTIGWDAFVGGAGVSNFVYLRIMNGGTTVFETGVPGTSNALAGTALSVKVPANTLQTGVTYDATLGFYHVRAVTNNSANVSYAFRASATQFSVATTGGGSGTISVSGPQVSNGTFSFLISSSSGQTVTVLSSSDVTLPIGQWPVLQTLPVSGSVRFVDPRPATSKAMFYRVRTGN